MDDNTLDDANSPEAGRPRRTPPTIDLEASEVTASTTSTDSESADAKNDGKRSSRLSSASLQPFLVAAITGAVTAALVIAVAWALGRPAETAQPVAEINAGAIEALSSRLAELEGRASKPAAPDPALASRFDALEKSLAGLKSDVAGARAQTAKLATDIEAIKSAPPASAASPASPDLTAIEGRIAELERAVRAESERSAQAASRPADDVALRRLVVASMLDLSVRQGEPFTEALKAAKALASDPQMFKPLEDFAALGRAEPGEPLPRAVDAGAETRAAGGKCHSGFRHRRASQGGRGETGAHRAHRYGRHRPRRHRLARHRSRTAQRRVGGAARAEVA